MEKTLNQIQVVDQIKSSLEQAVTPTYDHIELTAEEVEAWTSWALLKARKAKAKKLNEVKYAERIRQDKRYPQFTYDQLYEFIQKEHPKFVIDDNNREIFELLCQYFTNDPAFELSGYSLEKGLLLQGPIGCGKTEMMKVFSVNTFRPFVVTPCRTIADAYAVEGTNSLYEYSNLLPVYPQRNFGHDAVGICYDDLGTEDDKKNFGNQVNVMQDIMFKLYDTGVYKHFHVTSNIGGEEIEAMYGARVRSRMREMFNQIKFTSETPDRRK